ncbi:MAG TPA: FlgT C-terminal domain-containing protein [Pyrinomonadaceae bacterium]|nr:FlgT C-terminal domain-containing protein [Pyrinomonadaceae bacterium]
MRFQIVCKRVAASVFAAVTVFAAAGLAQQKQRPVVLTPIIAPPSRSMRIAERNNLYCAGYVQTSPIDTSRKIVGAVEEQETFLYSQNNFVYINAGANKGVQVGDMFSVVRPRGQVKSHWTRKGSLGFYTEEVGALEVVRVKPEVAVARVKTSCSDIMLGDLVQPLQVRVAPEYKQRPALDLFGDPSGKAVGRLIMSRDNVDLITRDFIVYIDLGAEDNVQVGDYVTVFRKLGKGNPFFGDWGESASARDSFDSFEYRGGRFSNQTGRKKGDTAEGKVVTTASAKEDRPYIRKVVGEMVILNVKERVATALVTRTAQEIHTGDWVEVQ